MLARGSPEYNHCKKNQSAIPVASSSGPGRFFGYTHFLLKGLEKVRTAWSLMTLVYNLKRVFKLVSFERLMNPVGAKMPQRA